MALKDIGRRTCSTYRFLCVLKAPSSCHLIAPGMAFRVPTPDVSVVDLTFTAEKDTSIEETRGSSGQS